MRTSPTFRYVPVRGGYLYLVAIMDWASRFVLAWELDNTLEVGFCVSALAEAMERYGPPLISNTDQGSQFTSEAYVGALTEAGVRISMGGRGRWIDNRFIERLWRSLKYEAVYLEELDGGRHARQVIASWMTHYNHGRPQRCTSKVGGRRRPRSGRYASSTRTAARSWNRLDPTSRDEGPCGKGTRAFDRHGSRVKGWRGGLRSGQ